MTDPEFAQASRDVEAISQLQRRAVQCRKHLAKALVLADDPRAAIAIGQAIGTVAELETFAGDAASFHAARVVLLVTEPEALRPPADAE